MTVTISFSSKNSINSYACSSFNELGFQFSQEDASLRNSSNIDFVNEVAKKNVELTMDKIVEDSQVLAEMQANGEIKIVGGMYDINSGAVHFYD